MAVLRTLQAAWPHSRYTWIIGKTEAKLMGALLPEVEFITFTKGAGLSEFRRLYRLLSTQHFDLLLHMQLSLRASLLSTLVHAPIKLGFDRARAREAQWLFTNARIEPAEREHVLDSLLGFARACGVATGVPLWKLSLPCSRDSHMPTTPAIESPPILVISPCSSHGLRNWSPGRYAAVADHAVRAHGMRVILAGGPSGLEIQMGAAIMNLAREKILNQIGADTLPQLLDLLSRSSVLISPDSGPVHMATMVGLPVIGLYAATNPARSGPYFSQAWCVNKYPEAARQFLGKPPESLPWTTKIERPGVMDLIQVSEVTNKLDHLMRERQFR